MEENEIEKNNKIKEAIVKTVAFFDIFDFPLTSFEIWKFCDYQCELNDIVDYLNSENNSLERMGDFYFLPGRSELFEKRKKSNTLAKKKYQKALRITKIFRFIPWIKMIAISNVIGQNNVREDSDIDLFIVTERGRIWMTRFISVLLVKILGLRPSADNVKDKICLSFFISENNLCLKDLMIDNDIYFCYWLSNLVPIYNQDDSYKKLIQENNWLFEKMPNWSVSAMFDNLRYGKGNSIFYRDVIDMLVGGLELNVKNYQLKVMSPILRELMNEDTRVVVNDGVLKLISNDRREYYRDLYLKKIKELI